MDGTTAQLGVQPTKDGLVLFVVGGRDRVMIPYAKVPEVVGGIVGALTLPYLSAEQAKIAMKEIWGLSSDE